VCSETVKQVVDRHAASRRVCSRSVVSASVSCLGLASDAVDLPGGCVLDGVLEERVMADELDRIRGALDTCRHTAEALEEHLREVANELRRIRCEHEAKGSAYHLLRIDEVAARLSVTRQTIYRYMHEQEFPRPLRLSEKSIAWRERDVQRWIDSRPLG